MELFNKYKNKDFIIITNYINRCINNPDAALTENELSKELLGDAQNTFNELITALFNKNPNGLDSKHPNANLFMEYQGGIIPIRDNYIPIRLSTAEKSWLLYMLQNGNAKLFLEEEIINTLTAELKADLNIPDISKCIDIRTLNDRPAITYTEETKKIFRTIVSAIKEKRAITITNTAFNGIKYENQLVYPYKLEYSPQFDSFSLSALNVELNRPIKMNLQNLSNISICEPIDHYDDFIKEFETKLTTIREKEPVVIEITDEKNGYDRCSYKFSSFDRICYENENGNLTMNIFYYRFQKDEIIRNLMFLGPAVRIISPANIREEFISILKDTYDTYDNA